MEKIWYLFLENHHKGPFSAEEIFKMFHSDQIGENGLVWRQGMAKWIHLKDCEELWQTISPKPRLPELPIDELPALPQNQKDVLPELPREALEPELKADQDILNLKPKRRIPWGWLAAGVFCCVLFAFFLDRPAAEKAPDWSNLSLLESERLKNIAQVRLREGVKVGLAASPRETRVYFATNRSGPAVVTLQISSEPQRILGPDPVIASAEAKMEGHFLVFSSFKFSSGSSFIPGYYRVQLDAVSFHPQRKIINQLIRWGILSKEGYSEKFIYRGELLVSDVPASRFDQDLKNYLAKVQEEAIFPYVDLKERYNTLLSFSDQLFSFFQNQVELSKEGFNQAAFLKSYASELGHLFQVFVEDTQKNKDEAIKKIPNLATDFNDLNLSAENIGGLVGEMTQQFNKIAEPKNRKVRKKGRKELLDNFIPKFDKIKNDLKTKLGTIEQKINDAKKN